MLTRGIFLESLRHIEGMEAFYTGAPAAVAPRPVLDSEYDFAIVCVFKDVAAHDAYQVHPTHKAFLARFKDCWERVRVSDMGE